MAAANHPWAGRRLAPGIHRCLARTRRPGAKGATHPDVTARVRACTSRWSRALVKEALDDPHVTLFQSPQKPAESTTQHFQELVASIHHPSVSAGPHQALVPDITLPETWPHQRGVPPGVGFEGGTGTGGAGRPTRQWLVITQAHETFAQTSRRTWRPSEQSLGETVHQTSPSPPDRAGRVWRGKQESQRS